MKSLQEIMKKEKFLVLLLVGLLLLILALPVKSQKKGEEGQLLQRTAAEEDILTEDWQTKMEKRLKKVLQQVKGVGEVEVFLTCESTEKKIVEKDETDTVYEKDAKGNQMPYVASEEYPRVSGVLIVAGGGDNPVVIQNIQEAVQALFQVEAHKIKVMKMN